MGLIKGGINEVIATTAFNAAPIGIHFRDKKASMILFSGSHTAENIERDRWVVANIIHDPVLYVRTAFEDLPRDAFAEEPVSGRMMVRLTQEKEIIEEVAVHPVNRGFNSIIDATVHATRYRVNHETKLRHLIDYHADIVQKCGGKKEIEALELLMRYVGE